ncbi:MAG: electron transport complex subunit RsxC [Bacteroidales bacterium]
MLKTFSLGGTHPPEHKLSAHSNLALAPIEGVAVFPIGQNIGAPSAPIVTKGDKVKVGQLIAKASGFMSANLHSSVSGTVLAVEPMVCDSSLLKKVCITIQIEGDEWLDSINRTNIILREITLSQNEIVQKIQESGIVGLGGATFPTHVKLTPPEGRKAEVLIINAVECEPYLTADHRLMLEHGEEILIGTELLKQALNVKKVFIGIENNKLDAIAHLRNLCKKLPNIKIVPLQVKYPQGGEKQLIKAITGKEVPSMQLPIDVGVVVQNVATAYAVYEAVQKNNPLIERVVTVTGKKLINPRNFVVRIGTSVDSLLSLVGGIPENTGKIIVGGPMMGKATASTTVPITKGSSGILLFDESEAHRNKQTACIRCAKCVDVCPMGLAPYLLSKQACIECWDDAETDKIQDCIDCGCCLYTCPANIPLLDYIRFGKNEVIKRIRSRVSK